MAKHVGDVEMRGAVGRVNGENMMCIIIPCHRVIRADGTLCGIRRWIVAQEMAA
jgi:AraC family transcriptional regulator of adaptative response/methylated-DNA-[protein]-cysteine methyltransferase